METGSKMNMITQTSDDFTLMKCIASHSPLMEWMKCLIVETYYK